MLSNIGIGSTSSKQDISKTQMEALDNLKTLFADKFITTHHAMGVIHQHFLPKIEVRQELMDR